MCMSQKIFKYDAFISYRHAELDSFVAELLHKQLESFKVPKIANKEIKETGKQGIKRVFRDKDELPLVGNLSAPITEALKDSEFLIVICSPRTQESLWVQREIETFLQYRDASHILAVLIEGEPDASVWGITREHENEVWDSELRLMGDIKTNFDIAITMIENGEAEQTIIDAENW